MGLIARLPHRVEVSSEPSLSHCIGELTIGHGLDIAACTISQPASTNGARYAEYVSIVVALEVRLGRINRQVATEARVLNLKFI